MAELIFWLWIYRIAAIGIACVISYFCGRTIGIIINIGEKKMGKPMQGNKKERRQARRKRRIVSVSRFKKASKGM